MASRLLRGKTWRNRDKSSGCALSHGQCGARVPHIAHVPWGLLSWRCLRIMEAVPATTRCLGQELARYHGGVLGPGASEDQWDAVVGRLLPRARDCSSLWPWAPLADAVVSHAHCVDHAGQALVRRADAFTARGVPPRASRHPGGPLDCSPANHPRGGSQPLTRRGGAVIGVSRATSARPAHAEPQGGGIGTRASTTARRLGG